MCDVKMEGKAIVIVHLIFCVISVHVIADSLSDYGVISSNEEELAEVMADIDQWGFDIFRLSNLTDGRPLTAVLFTIFKQRDLFEQLDIDPDTFCTFINSIEDEHKASLGYHSPTHSADVAQTCHVLLISPVYANLINPMDVMVTLLACGLHDVGHTGEANVCLFEPRQELTDHPADSFKISENLLEQANIFSDMDIATQDSVLVCLESMIVATTDELMNDVTSAVGGALTTLQDNSQDTAALDILLKLVVILSNVSNVAKPLALFLQWIEGLFEEWFAQGLQEMEKGNDVQEICDPQKVDIPTVEVNFVEFVVQPILDAFLSVVGADFNFLQDNIAFNLAWLQGNVEYFTFSLYSQAISVPGTFRISKQDKTHMSYILKI